MKPLPPAAEIASLVCDESKGDVMPDLQSSSDTGYGPCVVCGDTNYELSCGGPTICPKCDCGNFDAASGTAGLPFQKRVVEWLMACFSMEVCRDGIERNHRFLEEALELVQSLDCTRSEAHQLVDYVFDRPAGEPKQELGGSLVTLTALANCHDMDMMEAGETELARVWTKIDKIRAKQAAKPKHSPLPQHVDVAQQQQERIETLQKLVNEYKARAIEVARG